MVRCQEKNDVRVENDFKNGKIKALVCTSTLELGIDIGSVDLTIQYMSPRSVSSLIQRVGRSGHKLDRISEGTIMAVSTDDIAESIASVRMAKEKKVEPITIHEKALDVLAHQIAGIILESNGDVKITDLLDLLHHAYPYRNLTHRRTGKGTHFPDENAIRNSRWRIHSPRKRNSTILLPKPLNDS